MAIFNIGKKEEPKTEAAAPVAQAPAAPKPAISAEEKAKLLEHPNLQRKVKELEKRNQFAEQEIEEHEEYLRKILTDLNRVQKQAKFQEQEIADQEIYLRKVMEDLVKTKKSNKFADKEIQEHEDYLRKIMQDLIDAQRKNKFAEQEIKEHEDYLRKVMTDFSKLNKSYKFAENEIKEHEDYLRKVMQDLAAANKKLSFAEREISEQEVHVRSVLSQLNQVQKEKKSIEREIAEQENYLRSVMTDYNTTKKQYDDLRSQFQSKEAVYNSEYQKRIDAEAEITRLQTEQKEAFKAFNHAIPFAELDMQGNVLNANKLYLDELNLKLTDIKGRNDRYFFDFDTNSAFEYDRLWNRLMGGLQQTAEFKRTLDNKVTWIKVTYTPVFNLDNKPVKVIKTERDVTKVRKVEGDYHAIKEAAQMQNVYFEIDAFGRIKMVNSLFSELLGEREQSLLQRNLRDLVHVSAEDFYAFENFWRLLSKGDATSITLTFKAYSGKLAKLNCNFQPVFDADGTLNKVICLATNEQKVLDLQTENRNLRTEIQETLSIKSDSERMLRGYLKGIDRTLGFIEYDVNGNVIHANDFFLNVFGYSLHEVKDAHHRMFVDPKFTKNYAYIEFWQELKEGKSQAGHYKRTNRRGDTLFVNSTYTPIKDDRGEVVSIIEFVLDVTDQTLLMNKFIEYIDDLRHGKQVEPIDFNQFNLFARQNQEDEKLDQLYRKLSESLNNWDSRSNPQARTPYGGGQQAPQPYQPHPHSYRESARII